VDEQFDIVIEDTELNNNKPKSSTTNGEVNNAVQTFD